MSMDWKQKKIKIPTKIVDVTIIIETQPEVLFHSMYTILTAFTCWASILIFYVTKFTKYGAHWRTFYKTKNYISYLVMTIKDDIEKRMNLV